MTVIVDTGNHLAAKAAVMCNPKVIPAYPITPQTKVVEKIAEYVESGEYTGDFMCVESEHSAMSACIGASAAGVRTFTATSSHGLLLMHEMLHWAALARLPIVMCNINRVIGPGWNIWADETDSISQRDTGWLQFYCSSNQEIFDTTIQAFMIAENSKVLLPTMVNFNAFILSHTSLPADVMSQKELDDFLPDYVPQWKLDTDNPTTLGNIIGINEYDVIRWDMKRAMDDAKKIIVDVDKKFEKAFGRSYGGLIEKYQCENAELILLAMGAIGAESKDAIDILRKEGLKVGLARVRVFRPFPSEEIIKLAKNADLVVIDRNISIGNEGALMNEVKACLHGNSDAKVYGFVAGLGGRDVTYHHIVDICKKALNNKAKSTQWFGYEEA